MTVAMENTSLTVSLYTGDRTQRAAGSLSNERTYKGFFETSRGNVTREEAGESVRIDGYLHINVNTAILLRDDTILVDLDSQYYQPVNKRTVIPTIGGPVSHFEYDLILDKRDIVRT